LLEVETLKREKNLLLETKVNQTIEIDSLKAQLATRDFDL